MVESGWVRLGLRIATWVILGFLYLPLVLVVIHAFNLSPFNEWPPTGFTLHWFGEALANSAIPVAFMNSIIAALGATTIALVLGTLASMAVQRFSFFGRDSISFLLVLPIALSAASTLAIDPRSFAIAVTVAASCSFITPFEPACLLVYGTGRYRFRDFILLGSGLTFIAYLVSLVLIPVLWPFRAA